MEGTCKRKEIIVSIRNSTSQLQLARISLNGGHSDNKCVEFEVWRRNEIDSSCSLRVEVIGDIKLKEFLKRTLYIESNDRVIEVFIGDFFDKDQEMEDRVSFLLPSIELTGISMVVPRESKFKVVVCEAPPPQIAMPVPLKYARCN